MESREQELFSEAEVGQLVRRAAELQEQGSAKGYVPGVTRQELQQLASEVGIDPEYLRKAIEERKHKPTKKKRKLSVDEIEKVLPVAIDPDDFDALTDGLKLVDPAQAGLAGATLRQVGRSVEGQVSGAWENPRFRVSSRDGRTKLRVWTDQGTPVALSVLWLLPLFASIAVGKKVDLFLGLAMALLAVLGAIFTYPWLVKKAQETTDEVAQKLEEAILEHASSASKELDELKTSS